MRPGAAITIAFAIGAVVGSSAAATGQTGQTLQSIIDDLVKRLDELVPDGLAQPVSDGGGGGPGGPASDELSGALRTAQDAGRDARCATLTAVGLQPQDCPAGFQPLQSGSQSASGSAQQLGSLLAVLDDPPVQLYASTEGISVRDRDGNHILEILLRDVPVASAEVQLQRELATLMREIQSASEAIDAAGIASATNQASDLVKLVPDVQCGITTANLQAHRCAVILGRRGEFAATHAPEAFAVPSLVEQGIPEGVGTIFLEAPILPTATPEPIQVPIETARNTVRDAPLPLGTPNASVVHPSVPIDLSVLTILGLLVSLFPLYHRIVRNDMLDNDVRKNIYDIVAGKPGLSVQMISELAEVSHSTATYHLEILERGGMIVSAQDGNKLRFYKNGGRFDKDERQTLPVLQNPPAFELLERIIESPGIHRAELAQRRGISTTTLNWYLRKLFDCGLIVEERSGRRAPIYPAYDKLAVLVPKLLQKPEAFDGATRIRLERLVVKFQPAPAPGPPALPAASAKPATGTGPAAPTY